MATKMTRDYGNYKLTAAFTLLTLQSCIIPTWNVEVQADYEPIPSEVLREL